MPCRLDHHEQPVEGHRLIIGVDVAFKDGINRDQIVNAIDLDSMAYVKNDRNIGVADIVDEIPQRSTHRVRVEITLEIDDIKARVFERHRHRFGIVCGIG